MFTNRAFGVSTRPGSRERRENAKIFASIKSPLRIESHIDSCIARGGENVLACPRRELRNVMVKVRGKGEGSRIVARPEFKSREGPHSQNVAGLQ